MILTALSPRQTRAVLDKEPDSDTQLQRGGSLMEWKKEQEGSNKGGTNSRESLARHEINTNSREGLAA